MPDIRNLADEEMMQLIQAGNPRAFELLYDRHGGAAVSPPYRVVGHRAIDGLRRSLVHDRRRETTDGIEERFEAREKTDVEAARREEARSVRSALDTLPED